MLAKRVYRNHLQGELNMSNDLTIKEYTPEELKSAFIKMYGGDEAAVRLYSSPARINIIGEHMITTAARFFLPVSTAIFILQSVSVATLKFYITMPASPAATSLI